MRNWNKINKRIKECLFLSNSIDCLIKLFNETKDGWVAYNLASEYEKMGNNKEALAFYKIASTLLPLPKYKEMAVNKIRELESSAKKEYEIPAKKNEILYVVMCTRKKIWDLNPSAPKYIPAKDAYQGASFKKWLESEESKKYDWLILSAKYGFIEPDHPICNYDVSFDNEESGPISNEILIKQVLYQERLGIRLRDVKKVYVIGNETYFKKVKLAFSCTDAEVIHYMKI